MPLDRASRQLTGYTPPPMRRPGPVMPEKDSIFGNTYGGVPNPMIPYQHPYPTRYHGPVFNYPMPGWQYETAPYARAPFNGDADSVEKALKDLERRMLIGGVVALGLAIVGIYFMTRQERAGD